jgi:Helix-hairpin-helix motif
MPDLINLNTAHPKVLTQLPGIAKNVAYKIANHRKRHGYFTHWEELLEVKEFPERALVKIKLRATLFPIEGVREPGIGPRRVKPDHLQRRAKKPEGYTKSLRSTRSSDRIKRNA